MSAPKPCPHCTRGVQTTPAGESAVCGHCDGAAVELPCCTDHGDPAPCETVARYADGAMPRCWLHAPDKASPVYPLTPEAQRVEDTCGYCHKGVYDGTNGPEVCPYCDGAGVNVESCGQAAFEGACDDAARFREAGILGARWRCEHHAAKGSEEVYPMTFEARVVRDAE